MIYMCISVHEPAAINEVLLAHLSRAAVHGQRVVLPNTDYAQSTYLEFSN